ncbi:hypothetical protein [Corynebacterium auriscanis]|uniref:hypothetical protein n=1 Tax=Corynebacterium auriscanis TaxID=99807 RepID=UPI003CEA64B1
MPTIVFRILSPADERKAIVQDFNSLVNATEGALGAEVTVTSGSYDPELARIWSEDFSDDSAQAEPATIRVVVTHNELGSLSHVTMLFAQLLTTYDEKPPAEPLLRQVQDDAGRPRVPWHVEVQP